MEGKKITLHYFNLNGRALLIKYLLTYGKINYENKTYSFEDWAKVKDNFDFKFLPVLEVDGVQLSQTTSIIHYVAKKVGGLLGKTDEDEQSILASVLSTDDFINPLINRVFGKGDQKENTDKLLASVEKIVIGLEKIYTRHGAGKYFLGETLSLGDFYLVQSFGTGLFPGHKDTEEVVKKSAPKLYSLIQSLTTSDLFVSLHKATAVEGATI
jgi:prostaglandin-H2 D-isomerase / glutathione transferase